MFEWLAAPVPLWGLLFFASLTVLESLIHDHRLRRLERHLKLPFYDWDKEPDDPP